MKRTLRCRGMAAIAPSAVPVITLMTARHDREDRHLRDAEGVGDREVALTEDVAQGHVELPEDAGGVQHDPHQDRGDDQHDAENDPDEERQLHHDQTSM